MSRIGRLPITIPSGVKVDIRDTQVTVQGPKGEISQTFLPEIGIKLEDNKLIVTRQSDEKEHRALHGLTRALLNNMVEGVTKGWEKSLEIVGVGFRAEKVGEKLILRVGFSHPIEVTPLPGVTLSLDGPSRIKVSGVNKETVGEMAAKIRAIRPPDAYKGKGIRYVGEVVRIKPGKAGKAVGKGK
ncbi:MAG: 50S ribosomal protein L6 [Dehalococcoidales bacterium]|jgi:large subunit ribosomal protein L6|nr:50S ribosomal protein L6 [Dehalococcoidales bacterium]